MELPVNESNCNVIDEESLLTEARSVLDAVKKGIEDHSIWLRRTSELDRVLGGHLRRATMALESTILLAENGAAHDAVVTARVVLEHALSAASIAMADDSEQEAYFFIMRQWRHLRNANDKLKKHYSDLTGPDPEMDSFVQRIVEQTDKSTVGERLDKIVKLLDEKHSPEVLLFSWLYEVPYNAMSTYAHPRALGLRSIVPPLGEPFQFIKEVEPLLATNAVRQGMIGFLAMMLAVHHAWGTPAMEKIVLHPIEQFIKNAGPAGVMGTYKL